MMKLRLGLLNEDIAFRFSISRGTTSSILITWIKLCSKQLSVLIIWPSHSQIRNNLPSCFQKLYPKVRCIIDCFTETPRGLDLDASMWSEYKHHYTFKVAPYGSAYFWTIQRYDYVNEYIIFFSNRHENRTALEYLEAILDNVSVTIAT